jgi:VanZ family protein
MVDVPVPLMATPRLLIAANLAYAVVLLILGLVPEVPQPMAGISDSVAHAVAYAILAALLFVLLAPSAGLGAAATLAVAGAVLYGGVVETLQLLQPARTADIRDLGANAVGAAAAVSILYLLRRPRSVGGSQ